MAMRNDGVAKSDVDRVPRLAERLAAARQGRFVGREAELTFFRETMLGSPPRLAVMHVHGPGGVGKTALLDEFASVAGANGMKVVRLDGRDLQPSPHGFLRSLTNALGLPQRASPLAALGEQTPGVLLVDTYENFGPLDAWLRESFLPQLSGYTTVVIAGRDPPTSAWRTDPDWSALTGPRVLRASAPPARATAGQTASIAGTGRFRARRATRWRE
jgi:hypothetical protein